MVTDLALVNAAWLEGALPLPDGAGCVLGQPAAMTYLALSLPFYRALQAHNGLQPISGLHSRLGSCGATDAEIDAALAWAEHHSLLQRLTGHVPDAPSPLPLRAGPLRAASLETRTDRTLRYFRLFRRPKRERRGSGRVLVTGGLGELGSLLVMHLFSLGYSVSVLDQELPRTGGAGIRFFAGDIRSREAVRAAMHECTAVIHLAAKKGADFAGGSHEAWSVNVDGTRTVAEAAREQGIEHLVFASSIAVYGAATGPISCDTPPQPAEGYGWSKYVGEQLLRESAPSVTVFRIAQTVHQDVWWRPRVWEFAADQCVEYVDSVHLVCCLARALEHPAPGFDLHILSGGPAWRFSGLEYAMQFETALPGTAGHFARRPYHALGWYDSASTHARFGAPEVGLHGFCDQVRESLTESARGVLAP